MLTGALKMKLPVRDRDSHGVCALPQTSSMRARTGANTFAALGPGWSSVFSNTWTGTQPSASNDNPMLAGFCRRAMLKN